MRKKSPYNASIFAYIQDYGAIGTDLNTLLSTYAAQNFLVKFANSKLEEGGKEALEKYEEFRKKLVTQKRISFEEV